MATINLGRVGFVQKGTYSGATAYKINDVVVYNNGVYACISPTTGNIPTNTTYWKLWLDPSTLVAKAGNETIAGVKTFSSSPIVPNATTGGQAIRYDQSVKLTGNETIAGVKTFSSTIAGSIDGTATTATKLATARTIQTNLGSGGGASFDGTENIKPGVTGTLAVSNGGTGATTAAGALANIVGYTPIQQGGGTSQGADKLFIGWSANTLNLQVNTTNFASTWPLSILGNAATVTKGVYTIGDQTIAGVKTFSSSPIVPTPTTGTQAVNKDYVDSGGATFIANDPRAKTALNASGSAPIYACRAWVNFNGTGTVAIRASGNVSSITDNGAGDYTVNFITAMPDANYSTVYSHSGQATSADDARIFTNVPTGGILTTSVGVRNRNESLTGFDSNYVGISVIR